MTESLFYNKNTNKWEIMGLNFVKDSSGGSGSSGTPVNAYSKTEVNNLLSGKLDVSTYNTDKANFKTKVTVVSETEPTDKEVIWVKLGSGNAIPNFGSQKTDKPTLVMSSVTGYIIDPNNLKEIKYFASNDTSNIKTTVFDTTLNFDDFVVLSTHNINAAVIIYIDKTANKLQCFRDYNNSISREVQPNNLSTQYEMAGDAPFYYAYNGNFFYFYEKATKQLCIITLSSSTPSSSTFPGMYNVVYK